MDMEYLKELTKTYYPFAFSLMPEELMATQLVIDSTQAVFLTTDDEHILEDEKMLKLSLLKHLVKLAKNRRKHFAHRSKEAFFRLSLEERMVVFLRDRMDERPGEIAQFLDISLQEVLSLLHNGRKKIIEANGITMEGIL